MSRRSLPSNPFSGTPFDDWIEALWTPDPLDRRYRAWTAVTTLLSPSEVWSQALRLLADSEPELRAAAAHWLAVTINRGALDLTSERQVQIREQTMSLLADADPDVRLAAAEAAVAWHVESPEVSRQVLLLLNDETTEPTSLALLSRLSGRLPDIADRSVPRLAALLSADSAEVREASALALKQLGARSMPAATELVAALEDEEPLVREFAAQALGQHDSVDDTIRHGLQAACDDEDAVVAAAAQAALSRLGGLL